MRSLIPAFAGATLLAVTGVIVFNGPTVASPLDHSAVSPPVYLQITRELWPAGTGIQKSLSRRTVNPLLLPAFSKTITKPPVVQQLYHEAQSLTTEKASPFPHESIMGVPPIGWSDGWGVELKVVFWQGRHRLLTVVDMGRMSVPMSNHGTPSHLLVDRHAAEGPGVSIFLHQLYHAIGFSRDTLLHIPRQHP